MSADLTGLSFLGGLGNRLLLGTASKSVVMALREIVYSVSTYVGRGEETRWKHKTGH